MFWKLTALSASSPVESILDKENFTLEELLDEEDIIQECKALNSRLINFLRDRAQVEQLLRYIIEEPPKEAENKRIFKFPFVACEIFTCEIDVILKTLVEEEELMNLLFSFLEPNRFHSVLLGGYFSKVVICLMVRKTIPLMNYVKAHQDIFGKLVDLIGITSIMEVLVRLVGSDDHLYPNSMDVMQWLPDSNLLEMVIDKLSPSCPPEVHANAAETLCAITRNAQSPLSIKLSSPSFVARIFGHALEESELKSNLVHSLSVCISLLDPKRSLPSTFISPFRGQHTVYESVNANSETVGAMLPKLDDFLKLLNVSSDENILPTTYGALKPPLGKHRLKIVEFIAVLLKAGNEAAENELVSSGIIQRVLDLFFEYPYNNTLHHHVESIILSCLESKNGAIVKHLFQDCNLVSKFLHTDKHPFLSGDQPTLPIDGKEMLRAGNIGHITRISNKLVQFANHDDYIQSHLKENNEWNDWQATVLQERNVVENIFRWACGRPTTLHDRTRDSDEDDVHDKDYDVAALANNLSHAFRYAIYDNENAEDGCGTLDRDDEDVYFDDESAEVVMSSLRLGDDPGSLFTNSNWFAFQDNRIGDSPTVLPSNALDEVNMHGSSNGSSSSSDDEVVVGEDDELTENKISGDITSKSSVDVCNGSGDLGLFRLEIKDNGDPLGDRTIPDWAAWGDSLEFPVVGSSVNPFDGDDTITDANIANPMEETISPFSASSSGESLMTCSSTSVDSCDGSVGSDSNHKAAAMPSLFEEDVEFVGVDLGGTAKAMEQALREGIVGEAGPLKRNIVPKKISEKDSSDNDDGPRTEEFNDANYWKVHQENELIE